MKHAKKSRDLDKIEGGESLAHIICGICENEFSNWKEFEAHINAAHANSDRFTVECPHCKNKLPLEVSPMSYKPGW
jgi:hypothetical protein